MKKRKKKLVDLIFLEDEKPESQLKIEYQTRIKTWLEWLENKQNDEEQLQDAYIEEQTELKEKKKLIDVIQEVEKHYKTCDMIPNNKKDQYGKFCIKKKRIDYEKELIELQVELLKLQNHIKDS